MKKIGIINCNINNLYSISNVFRKLGCETIVSSERKKLLDCDFLILPGVGAFNVAMQNIKIQNIDNIIIDFIKTGKLFLGICLGFQLLFEQSEEFVPTQGLGLIEGKIKKFNQEKLIVPHIGWNRIIYKNTNYNLENEKSNYFYFIHSFFAEPKFVSDIFCYTNYNNFNFCSGVKKNNLYGVQFHPEKSGKNGIEFLEKFIRSEL